MVRGPQRRGFHETAEQLLAERLVTAREDTADDQIPLAGDAQQHRLVRGQQDHVQRGVLLLCQSFGSGEHRTGHEDRRSVAAPAGDRRAGPVLGQVQDGQLTTEFLCPVSHVQVDHGFVHVGGQPGGVVEVGHRGRRAERFARQQSHQLAQQDSPRPVVGDDVVEAEDERGSPGRQPNHRDPVERRLVRAQHLAVGLVADLPGPLVGV